ncbi:RNA polymerase sigma factor [Sinomicrobium pectinilyticum]|nr:RNA polymerase sigma-70 factor [Sinomicrobium pectinilyticum]
MKKDALRSFVEDGDDQSFTEIFNAHYIPLVAYICQYTQDRSEAEDIAQNSFVKLWEKRRELRIHTSLKSYLYSTAYNLFIDKYRQMKKTNDYLENLKEEALYEMSGQSETELMRQLELLESAIEELPPKCRNIFILNKKEGFTYKEVAEKLNISVKTVETQMRIAMIKLRERLKDNPLVLALVLNM